MALLNDQLSLWEIGFRWASCDPARWWWRIPLSVRDNFRVLMDAILNGYLRPENMFLEKRNPNDPNAFPPEFYIRSHLPSIEACIEGNKFDRQLLRFVVIEREVFRQWCERQSIPLPEFWFPAGWSLEYRYPGEDEPVPEAPAGAELAQAAVELQQEESTVRPVQRARIACQQVALAIWKAEPNLTIKDMAERYEVQRLGGGAHYELEVVRRWLSQVDPRHPAKKRGRRKGQLI
jgi:hypothetical protein